MNINEVGHSALPPIFLLVQLIVQSGGVPGGPYW